MIRLYGTTGAVAPASSTQPAEALQTKKNDVKVKIAIAIKLARENSFPLNLRVLMQFFFLRNLCLDMYLLNIISSQCSSFNIVSARFMPGTRSTLCCNLTR